MDAILIPGEDYVIPVQQYTFGFRDIPNEEKNPDS